MAPKTSKEERQRSSGRKEKKEKEPLSVYRGPTSMIVDVLRLETRETGFMHAVVVVVVW